MNTTSLITITDESCWQFLLKAKRKCANLNSYTRVIYLRCLQKPKNQLSTHTSISGFYISMTVCMSVFQQEVAIKIKGRATDLASKALNIDETKLC